MYASRLAAAKISRMKNRLFCFILLFFVTKPVCFGTETAKIDFYVVEINKKIFTKSQIVSDVKNLKRRNNSDLFKYISGGSFSVLPYIYEDFGIFSNSTDLRLRFAWKPKNYGEITRYELAYKAKVSLPFQNSFSELINTHEFKDGETVFIHSSEYENETKDTRPVYTIISFSLKSKEFAFEQIGTIGIKLGVKGGYPVVEKTLKGSPAEISGLRTGDQIRNVNGYSCLQMSIRDVAKLIKGKPQAEVSIKAYRPSTKEIMDFKIKRNIIYEGY